MNFESLTAARRVSENVDYGDQGPRAEPRPRLVVIPSQFAHLTSRRRKRTMLSVWALAVDLLCISLAFFAASHGRLGTIDGQQIFQILVIILPFYLGLALNSRAHGFDVLLDAFKSASRATAVFLFAAAAILLIAFFMKIGAEFSRLLFGFGVALSVTLLIGWRMALARIGKRHLGVSPFATLCIYDDVPRGDASGEGAIFAADFGLSPNPNDPSIINNLGRIACGMDSIVVHCSPAKRREWAFMLKSLDVPSEIVIPELTDLRPLEIRQRSGQTSLVLASGPLEWNQRLVKRTFDLVVTGLLMPVLLPMLGAVALAVKLDSPGPIFFKQDRIGLGNRRFKILKFRSMRVESSDQNGDQSTARNDSRITRVGEILRKTSLDELPQLLNVLAGSMSLVGPRPHAIGSRAENLLFWDIDQRYWHRHCVKPGMTGLAQIRGFRGATEAKSDLSNRLQSDLEYVSNWSLASDIKILLRTASVLFHRNAY